MEPPRDFCELLELFNAHQVKAIVCHAPRSFAEDLGVGIH